MLIDIHELELHNIEFQEEFPPGVIELGEDVRQIDILRTCGHAELVEEHHGDKRKIIEDILERSFELLYRPEGPEGSDAGQEEISVSGAESEIGYYSGNGLVLEDTLREQVLLSVPLRLLCRDDCKGLCSQCGKNLNVGSCSCAPQADPRWHVLEGWKEH
ncbi:MAG: DUF177 domain-containing protein [Terriglobales bacterium]